MTRDYLTRLERNFFAELDRALRISTDFKLKELDDERGNDETTLPSIPQDKQPLATQDKPNPSGLHISNGLLRKLLSTKEASLSGEIVTAWQDERKEVLFSNPTSANPGENSSPKAGKHLKSVPDSALPP
jgi:hypothetical protein